MAYENKLVTIPDLNNYTVKLQIWDTAGSEKYKSVTTAYLSIDIIEYKYNN